MELATEFNDAAILEADFVTKANDVFHLVSDRVKEKTGKLDSGLIFLEYNDWLRREVKKRKME